MSQKRLLHPKNTFGAGQGLPYLLVCLKSYVVQLSYSYAVHRYLSYKVEHFLMLWIFLFLKFYFLSLLIHMQKSLYYRGRIYLIVYTRDWSSDIFLVLASEVVFYILYVNKEIKWRKLSHFNKLCWIYCIEIWKRIKLDFCHVSRTKVYSK